MNRELILVEIVNKNDMSTDKSKAFNNTEKAEEYFTELVKEWFPTIEQDDIDNALDDGFYDFVLTHKGEKEEKSVMIKEITFVED